MSVRLRNLIIGAATVWAYCLITAPTLYAISEPVDLTNQGGELSNGIPGHNGIQVAAPNVDDQDLRERQLLGFSPFHQRFTKKAGFGPKAINNSCAGCHEQNGPGRIGFRKGRAKLSTMVVKVSLRGVDESGAPRDVPGVGEQLQDARRGGNKRHNIRLKFRKMKGGAFADGEPYELFLPRFKFKIKNKQDVVTSLRRTPHVVGMGLLQSIPEADILALADPSDVNSDGIRGIPQYVPNKLTGQLELGRFGWRSSHPTLAQQSAAAAFFDMGVTTNLFPGNGKIEMDDETFDNMVIYQALAGVPFARNQNDPSVLRGKEIFSNIGCDSCHTITFVTQNSIYSELDGQTIHPLSDMLLHDMGEGLADEREEYNATGRHWRTAPLWALGFVEDVASSAGQRRVPARYLHDGRARSIQEAILWHGGEGEGAKENFRQLSKTERDDLVTFLRSL